MLVDDAEAVVAKNDIRGAANTEEAANGGTRAIEAAFRSAHVFDDDNGAPEDEWNGAFEGRNSAGEALELCERGAGAGGAIVEEIGVFAGGEEEGSGEASAL
eukprot:scaffold263182_cov18-Tisochrysis_lutea.AAC.1